VAYTTKKELIELIDRIEAEAVDEEVSGSIKDWLLYTCQQRYHKMDKKKKDKNEKRSQEGSCGPGGIKSDKDARSIV
jgi:hypothetical protein